MPAFKNVPATGNQDIDGLLSSFGWAPVGGSYHLTYSFPTSASQFDYYQEEVVDYGYGTFQQVNAAQKAAVADILAMYSSVANITFAEVNESVTEGTLRFAQSNGNYTAFAYYPDTLSSGGDAWFSSFAGNYANPQPGNYGWHTFIHEIGHALGLKHGHNTGVYGALTPEHNSMEFSVMTYAGFIGDNPNVGGFLNEQGGYAQTLMMYDIAALQYIYGANFNTNSGNTTYSWSTTTGQMFVNSIGQDAPVTNIIFMTLWDGGGIDTYDLSNYDNAVTIDLNPGGWTITSFDQLADLDTSRAGGTARGNIANALLYQGNPASLIENAVGGNGGDFITGNQANNNLYGGPGDDALLAGAGDDGLNGGPGNDTIDGGQGFDGAVFSGLSTAYVLTNLGNGSYQAAGPDGTDLLINIEAAIFEDRTLLLPGIVYLRADNGNAGSELWRLLPDGTLTFWADINPGAAGSDPNGFTPFNNAMWFAADDGVTGVELYKAAADGSVTQWTEHNPGGGDFNPNGFTVFNNALWFAAADNNDGVELWKLGADGSVTQWSDINSGGGNANPEDFIAFSNALWFGAFDGLETEIWKLGADGSLTQWTDIRPGAGDAFAEDFTVFADAMWFEADDGTDGSELWKLGADGSVTQWSDINPGAGGADPHGFTAFNNALWFSAFDGVETELWKLGADGSLTQWTDINPGAGGSNPQGMTVFNNALWFAATDGSETELWKLGADGSVTQWTDINPGGGASSLPNNLIEFNGALWFVATSPGAGAELWKLGADGSVTLWTDINPGALSSDPREMFVFGTSLYFEAHGPQGEELYELTAEGNVSLVADIWPGPNGGHPHEATVLLA